MVPQSSTCAAANQPPQNKADVLPLLHIRCFDGAAELTAQGKGLVLETGADSFGSTVPDAEDFMTRSLPLSAPSEELRSSCAAGGGAERVAAMPRCVLRPRSSAIAE